MRRTAWVVGALLLALLPHQTEAQSSTPTPTPVAITALAKSGQSLVFAGTQCGAYQLSNNAQWQKIPGLDQQISQLVILPDGTVFTSAGGIYRAQPGGPWELVTDPGTSISGTLAVNGRSVYVGGESVAGARAATLFRSDDAGQTWQQLASPGGERTLALEAVFVNYEGPRVLTALVGQSGRSGGTVQLRRSLDDGATWTTLAPPLTSTIPFSFYTLNADDWNDAFYAAGYTPDDGLTRLYRLPATGAALEEVPLPSEIRREGINDTVNFFDTLAIASRAGFFHRLGSERFQRFDQGLNGLTVNTLAETPGAKGGISVYAGTSAGVFTGYPGISQSWTNISYGFQPCTQTGPSPYDPIPPVENRPTRRYFRETGHSLSYEFKSFWERNGALPVFGYPLSEEFPERNIDLGKDFTTQYFERERFEFHGENQEPYRVLLGRLGDELLRAQGRDWRSEGTADNPFPRMPCQSFAVGEQQRAVCGPFLSYWREHGLEFDGQRGTSASESLALFGLPLTAPKIERNPDGDEVVTQWFERARFEYHPNNPAPYRVLLGRLGSETLRTRSVRVP